MDTKIVEFWKPIPNLDRYEISNLGKIWDNHRLCELKQFNAGGGYLAVVLNVGGIKPARYTVHRLVLWAFWGVLSTHHRQCNHKDGNKQNNHLSNLELVTPGENIKHAYSTGLNPGAWFHCKNKSLKN